MDKYVKFNLKNKIIASVIIFIIIIFSLIYFIVIPTISDIKTTGNKIEAQKIDLEKKYIKSQSLRQFAENLKKIEPKLDLLDQIFINKNRELEFITNLENKANTNQVTQKINLSSAQTTENQEFKKNSLQLSTNGKFIKQLKYLMDIESLSYYINIKSLELTASDNRPIANINQEINNTNMLIIADTYWKE